MNKPSLKRILIVTIILSIVPIVFYVCNFNPSTFSRRNADWGTFGDYLGGTLGIILAGITIYLLYETYKSQDGQLEIQRERSQIDYIDLQYDQIIKDINEISFKTKRGSDALYEWDVSHLTIPNNVINTLNFILHTFNAHIQTIFSNNRLDEKRKEQFLSRAYLMFHSKIIWPVLSTMYNDPVFKGHTDNLYDNFNNLIKDTYSYLVPRNKLANPTDQRILAVL